VRVLGGHVSECSPPPGVAWRASLAAADATLDISRGPGSPVRVTPLRRARRAGLLAAIAALPFAIAYRFALVYRVRAGYPRRHPPAFDPADVGLAFESLTIPTADGIEIPAWWIPAGRDPAPGVVLVHGWESSRDRTLPHAEVIHALGMHVLTIDVRGHGANGPEALPLSVGEYALDTLAAVAELRRRPEITSIGLLGHSMGAAGVLVAAASDPGVDAVIAVAAPAGPHRLTRQTFRLAHLPIPGVIAWPLAWLTTRVYLRPRGHSVSSISAGRAVRSIAAPVMLVHGSDDGVVPASDLARLAAARRSAVPAAVTETLLVDGGYHSWLYEFPAYRAAIGRFLARSLGGAHSPDDAARIAEAVPAVRLPDPERLVTLDEEPGGLRSLARLVRNAESTASIPTHGDA
jgi:alpha-beta hydrolase superfamily lysophospholipase